MSIRFVDYYKELGVPPNASKAEIAEVYHQLMKLYHDDAYQKLNLSPEEVAKRQLKVRQLNDAYTVLSQDELRTKFDRERADFLKEQTAPSTPTGTTIATNTYLWERPFFILAFLVIHICLSIVLINLPLIAGRDFTPIYKIYSPMSLVVGALMFGIGAYVLKSFRTGKEDWWLLGCLAFSIGGLAYLISRQTGYSLGMQFLTIFLLLIPPGIASLYFGLRSQFSLSRRARIVVEAVSWIGMILVVYLAAVYVPDPYIRNWITTWAFSAWFVSMLAY